MGPAFPWTTTRPTHSSGGTPTRTSTSSARRAQRAPGLSHPCLASIWRKVRAPQAVGDQSVPTGIPLPQGKGCWWAAELGQAATAGQSVALRWERRISWTFPLPWCQGPQACFCFSSFALKALFAQSRLQPYLMPQDFGDPNPKSVRSGT